MNYSKLHPNETLESRSVMDLAQHQQYLMRFALRRVGNRDVAESLVQETFVGALESCKRYNGRASQRTWLTGILRNKVADYFCRAQRERSLFSSVPVHTGNDEEFALNAPAPAQHGAERRVEREELSIAIATALEKLPPRAAAVFRRAVIEGEDRAAVCDDMNLSPSSYWVTLHRARKQLQNHLAGEDYGHISRQRNMRRAPATPTSLGLHAPRGAKTGITGHESSSLSRV